MRIQPELEPDRARFNVLMTEDRPYDEGRLPGQLRRLLEPQGVATFLARSGREAIDLAGRLDIHAAVIDLGTPVEHEAPIPARDTAGLWLLELMRRLPNRPPIVILRKPAFSRQQAERLLHDLLRLGAFSVLSKPVHLEQLLTVFQRLVDRRYRGAWPGIEFPRPDRD